MRNKVAAFGKLAFVLSMAMVLFCGCSAAGMDNMVIAEKPAMNETMSSTSYASMDSAAALTSADFGGHKVIQNFELNFETAHFDEDIAYITERAAAAGGYAESSSINGKKPETYQERGRSAYMVLRIPADRVMSFFEDMKKNVGTLLYSDQYAQNITEQYFDTETRLTVLETQLERLTSILIETDNLSDIIELENEIARITLEIESLTTELRRWDGLVDYATVSISLAELSPTEGPADVKSVSERMGAGFQNTLNGMGVFFENLAVFLVAASPIIIPLAAIATVIILIIRRNRIRRAAQDAARSESRKKPENS